MIASPTRATPRLFFLILSSSALLILSFPAFDIWLSAWVGLVPLLLAVEDRTPMQAFLISYLVGILFYLGAIYWLIHVTLPGMVAVVLYLALYFGLFGLYARYAMRKGAPLAIVLPSAWVALEYLRSKVFTGMGWALLGYSQYRNLPMIQIADVFGAYGVSFLIVMVSAGIYKILKDLRPAIARRYGFDEAVSFKILSYLAPISLSLLLAFGYGTYRLNNIFTGPELKVSIIQGNIPQENKWDSAHRAYIMDKYSSLTRQAAKDNPDVIIWPETAAPDFLNERDIEEWLKGVAREIKIPILAGVPRMDEEGRYYNSAIFLSGEGETIALYDKLHLVPFGEYIPLKKVFSFVELFAPMPIGDYSKGGEYTVFKVRVDRTTATGERVLRLIKIVKFSALICFEDIFPDLVRDFVKGGAQFLVNVTNDAWFKKSSAPYQHAQASVFRAVENRVNVVRAANTGVSCFIDQRGRILDKVSSGGRDIFVEGWRTHSIILTSTRTVYTTYGDAFTLLSFLVVVYSLIRGNRAKGEV